MKKIFYLICLVVITTSCISTKSTLKNIDNNAPTPSFIDYNTFVIKDFSTDIKYGYNKDYPINVFFANTYEEDINQKRFLNALAGPKGQKISYTKLESCCPFPTKQNSMGVGLLDIYEVKWEGLQKPLILYFNIYEKGALMVPVGLSLKKINP